jgi:Calx-beta domain
VDIGAVEVNYAISIKAGDGQTAAINSAFATQLQVTVTESGNPVSGVPVTFTAPASGASGTFQTTGTNTATVNTDANGVATAPALTANGAAGGPYNVVASTNAGSPSFNFSLTNAKGNQTITFGPLPDKTFGDPDFDLIATASSGLPVSFTAMTLGPCTVSGSTVHITGAGSCAISASQAGDSNYNAAAAVIRFLNVAPAPTSTSLSSSPNPSNVGQSVTFTATVTSAAGTPPGGILGGAVFLDGGVMIPNSFVPLSSGHAAFTTSSLSPGIHTITAEYTTTNPSFVGSRATLQGGQVVNGGVFSFSQATYTVNEGAGSVVITVRRDGNTSGPASVDYATDDGSTPTVAVPCSSVTGLALERCDYTRSAGTLNFAAGDTQKTFALLVNDDSYVEGTEITHLRLSNPVGDALGPQSAATLQINDDDTTPAPTNPAADAQFFVRQHYLDFLNREPDTPGLQFWTSGITSCGADTGCTAVRRVNTSAAFFLSIEFQQTGYLVERIYKTAFGDATGTSTLGGSHQLSVPVVRLQEFLRDTQEIGSTPTQVVVGQGDWQTQLEANKNAFALESVARQRFTSLYPASLTADDFVSRLNANAGGVLTPSDISQIDATFGGPSASSNDAAKRAQALRQVAENPVLDAAEKNRAFVLMQFFGYLRRNPDDAQDSDYTGYDFWLQKLNQFGGDFVKAEMVKAFITSTEYRQRFGN